MLNSRRLELLIHQLVLALGALCGCSGNPAPICVANAVGGALESVPCPTTGGNAAVGGSFASVATGGNLAAGGTPGLGGTAAVGGVYSTGGTQQTGGTEATGGATATGGSETIGGTSATDMSATGGIGNTGGTSAPGGSSASGGAASTGVGSTDSCESGYADCDGDATNGCEVNLLSDAGNCGACGNACIAANGTPACSSGTCGILRCTPGFSDCNDSANDGCEVNVGTAGCLAESVYTLQVNDNACSIVSCTPLSSNPNATYACQQGGSTMNVTLHQQANGTWVASLSWPFGGFSSTTLMPLLETAQGFTADASLTVPHPGFTCNLSFADPGAASDLRVSIDCTGTGTATVSGLAFWDPMDGCPANCSATLSGSGTISSGGATKAGCSKLADAGITNDAGVQELPPLGPSPITAGGRHTCALLSDGTVRCWGDNSLSSLPVAVPDLTQVETVSAGLYAHTCALIADGTVRCWGDNAYGELGDGTTAYSDTPVTVLGLTQVVAVSAGAGFSCAVLRDGSVQCWGNNYHGELGNGSTVSCSVPTATSGIFGAVAVATGGEHACALMADGSALCWGYNFNGQLGNGWNSLTPNLVPAPVVGLSTAIAITAGQYHTCALLRDNSIRCWGDDSYKQLGDGGVGSYVPTSVLHISNAVAVSAGGYHTCALLDGGVVQCWGYNACGQLGTGTTTDSYVPVNSSLTAPAVALSAGLEHTCVFLQSGSAQCWGQNIYGQLGNGGTTNSYWPVTVPGIP